MRALLKTGLWLDLVDGPVFRAVWVTCEARSTFIDAQTAVSELMRRCDTRFASNLRILQRYIALQIVVEAFIGSTVYRSWFSNQGIKFYFHIVIS